jgi:adenylate cyclase
VGDNKGVGLRGWLAGPADKSDQQKNQPIVKPLGPNLGTHRIAVLPLVNISPKSEDEYFADGLTEELITRLSEVKGLKVIARTSIMNYKRKEKSVREIGKELGVSSIIEGSVRKAGSSMRVTVQLIDPETEEHLWASHYDRDLDDIFAIQTEIADKVAVALTLRESSGRTTQHTPDVLAYTMFLRANQLLHENLGESGRREALSLFTQATERDPGFARAYAGIARTWFQLGNAGNENFSKITENGKPAAMKSIELAPHEAEGHLAMALIYMAQDKFESVRSEVQKALQYNPNFAEAYDTLGIVQMNLDGPDTAIKSFQVALELDPFSLGTPENLALAYHALGRKADALEVLQKTAKLYRMSPWPHLQFARYHTWNQDYFKAQEHLDRFSELGASQHDTKRSHAAFQGLLYGLLGKRKEAEELLDYLRGLDNESARLLGIFPILAALGDFDEAFKCLMRMADLGSWWIGIKYIAYYAPLRRDPRYNEFCKKVGIKPQ